MTFQDEQLSRKAELTLPDRECLGIVYSILMDQWDNIPEEEREAIDKKLKYLGL
jgi:hypothetical protein